MREVPGRVANIDSRCASTVAPAPARVQLAAGAQDHTTGQQERGGRSPPGDRGDGGSGVGAVDRRVVMVRPHEGVVGGDDVPGAVAVRGSATFVDIARWTPTSGPVGQSSVLTETATTAGRDLLGADQPHPVDAAGVDRGEDPGVAVSDGVAAGEVLAADRHERRVGGVDGSERRARRPLFHADSSRASTSRATSTVPSAVESVVMLLAFR